MTFQADGKEIRNFTGADVGSGKAVKLEWQGAKNLAFGPHTITSSRSTRRATRSPRACRSRASRRSPRR